MNAKKSSDSRLVRLAERATAQILSNQPGLETAEPIERVREVSIAIGSAQGAVAELMAAIEQDSSFGHLRQGWVQQPSGYGVTVPSSTLTHLMIRSVLEGSPVQDVIKKAKAFAANPLATTEWYTPVAGITVKETVSLGKKFDLIPWSEVPASRNKGLFGQPSQGRHRLVFAGPFLQRQAFAKTAIRIRSSKCQVLFSSRNEAQAQQTREDGRHLEARDLVRCISALTAAPVAALGEWPRFRQPFPNYLLWGGSSIDEGYSFNPNVFDQAISRASSKPLELKGSSIALLWTSFDKFKPSEKEALRIVLDRLGQAMVRQNAVDKAIDLGIALETMLLHGGGSNDRGELRFRTAIRGARFLERSKAKRLKAFKLLRTTYDLRSRAVHTGALQKQRNKPNPESVLEDATHLCARISRKLIEQGQFPDWDNDYVI